MTPKAGPRRTSEDQARRREARAERQDVDLLERQLWCATPGQQASLPWLEESHLQPLLFWEDLKAAHDRQAPLPAKSTPLQEYDFYYDAMVRQREAPGPALAWIDAGGRPRALSFAELAELASRRAGGWEQAGAKAGEIVCIARPFGVESTVSLLAALKLGLTLSLLPPQGRSFLRNRLEALSPQWIDADEMHLSLLGEWEGRILRAGAAAAPESDRSHSYPTGSTVALLFDPARVDSLAPRPLSADAAYLCALRDGLLALGLRRGHTATAPGWSCLETQPSLLLSCWLVGATYLHLELPDVERDPQVLTSRPLRAVGVDERVRELLLQRPIAVGDCWGFWFRDPSRSHQLARWQRFIDVLGLKETFCSSLKWDAALGGCTLFSRHRRGMAYPEVLPSAGVPWQLHNPMQPEQPSVSDTGLLVLTPPGAEPVSTASLIARQGGSWLFAGSVHTTRDGRCYPTDEVLRALEELPGCSGCSICQAPLVGDDHSSSLVLLVFCVEEQRSLLAEVERRIRQEMGPESLPDRIEVFPLTPHRDPEGAIDHDWCRDQYLSGALHRKSKDGLYRCLSLLRRSVAEQ